VGLEAEALLKKRLEHLLQRFGRRPGWRLRGGKFGFDVEPVGFEPARSAEYFVEIDAICQTNEIDHGGAADFIVAGADEGTAHIGIVILRA